MPRYDIFLSHASADKPAVEYLARKLRARLRPDRRVIVAGDSFGRVHFFDFVEPLSLAKQL